MADALVHICEVCGVEKVMTPERAYKEGWDYPPSFGAFGVVSPRTCGECPIDQTLWWRLVVKRIAPTNLSVRDRALMNRINSEPESITP